MPMTMKDQNPGRLNVKMEKHLARERLKHQLHDELLPPRPDDKAGQDALAARIAWTRNTARLWLLYNTNVSAEAVWGM